MDNPDREVREDGLLVYRTNPMIRILGAIHGSVALSGWGAALLASHLHFIKGSPILPLTLMTLYAIASWSAALYTYDLTLNAETHRYHMRFGILPFVWIHEGTEADFDCLRIVHKVNRREAYWSWSVQLHWKRFALPPFVLEDAPDEAEARQLGIALSERLQLPIELPIERRIKKGME